MDMLLTRQIEVVPTQIKKMPTKLAIELWDTFLGLLHEDKTYYLEMGLRCKERIKGENQNFFGLPKMVLKG